MLVIGNKKYRNLQEQVGWNTEQIDKIFEFLDGINVSDNVVVVPDLSYILNQDELDIINRQVAFIVYDGKLYIKKGADSSTAYFDVVFSITGSTTITFNGSEIQVTLSNGALGIINSTVSTYSVSQIDSLLSAKASVTYVDTQLALKADKNNIPFENIKDTNNNARFIEGDLELVNIAGLTKTYGKWSLSGTHLMIVLAFDASNGSTINAGAVLCYVEGLPAFVRNKIIPVFGQNIIFKEVNYYNTDLTKQTVNTYLRKVDGAIVIVSGGVTLDKDRSTRIQFDLLIDNS